MSSILFKMKLNITYQKPCNPYSFSNVIRLIKKKKIPKNSTPATRVFLYIYKYYQSSVISPRTTPFSIIFCNF